MSVSKIGSLNPQCRDCPLLAAVEGLSDGLILADERGDVLAMNGAAQRLLGIEERAVLGRPLRRCVKDERLALLFAAASHASEDFVQEIRLRTPSEGDLIVRVLLCHNSKGAVTARAIFLEDVTDRVEVRLQLSRAMADPILALAKGGCVRLPAATLDARLSAAELRVLSLVGRGLRNREIAAKLFLSESTVKTHVSHLLKKLGFKSRSEAAAYAVKRGLDEI